MKVTTKNFGKNRKMFYAGEQYSNALIEMPYYLNFPSSKLML